MASIREVAKIAGVSPATVSRVMNGTANVDEEKKQRVLDAIQETGSSQMNWRGHCLRNHQRLLE